MNKDYGPLKQTYDRDGLLKIDQLFTEERMIEIETQLARYVSGVVPLLPTQDVVFETGLNESGEKAIRNLWRMEYYSEYFAELARNSDLLKLIGVLVNGIPNLVAVELFAKPSRVGSAVPYHQDNAYFNYSPPDALTCWIALDESNLTNGCVYYVRGSHRQGVLPHIASYIQGNSLKIMDPPDPSDVDEIPGVLSRGGAIIHHCCLLHRSEQNTSEKPRRGLLLVYHGSHCEEDPVGMSRYLKALEEVQIG